MSLSKIPIESECTKLLLDHGVAHNVLLHCVKVQEVSLRIANRCDANIPLVSAGALLHDIGRAVSHDLSHAYLGAEILMQHDIGDEVIAIVRKHTGAGFTVDEAQEMGLPDNDYMPSTLEEKIVCHADNLVAGTKLITLQEKYDKEMKKGHISTALRIKSMHEELSSLCGIDLDILLKN